MTGNRQDPCLGDHKICGHDGGVDPDTQQGERLRQQAREMLTDWLIQEID